MWLPSLQVPLIQCPNLNVSAEGLDVFQIAGSQTVARDVERSGSSSCVFR
jgi:hypothetical protein